MTQLRQIESISSYHEIYIYEYCASLVREGADKQV